MHRRARRLLALTFALASSACRREAASTPPPLRAATSAVPEAGALMRAEPRQDAQPMRWQAASWLTRAEREAEEQPECSTPCPSSPARQWPTWAPASSTTPGAFRRVSVTAARCNATDLQPEMLEVLRQAMRQRGIRNVVAVQATPESTGLPEARVELALLVDVYHEVAEPQPFLRQMRRPLTPDGRVVLVEFRAEDQDVPIRAEHKMAADQVIAELVLGGFRLTERYEFLPWQHLLVFVQAR